MQISPVAHFAASSCCSASRATVLGMRMPDKAFSLLPEAVRNHAIFSQAATANWDALRACYPSEEATLDAVTEVRAVLLPYGADSLVAGFYELGMAVDRSDKISGSYAVLKEKLKDEDEVLEVITKNPGVLGVQPDALDQQEPDVIRRFASVASGINGLFSPVCAGISSCARLCTTLQDRLRSPAPGL